MAKRILAAVLALALCLAPVACNGKTSAPASETWEAVQKLVQERELVSQEHLQSLDESLAGQIMRYNELTALLQQYYKTYAEGIAQTLYTVYGEEGVDCADSDLYHQWVTRITHYALYENAVERCHNDPYLSEPLEKEAGGSWGMWPQQLHTNAPETVKAQLQEYFTLTDNILTQTKIKD